MQEIGLHRLPDFDEFVRMQYHSPSAYNKLFARYQNLSGEREWSAIEFNPETISDHFSRHAIDFGLSTAQDYERAALAFINSPTEKLSFVDDEGTRRYFEENTGIFASAYPDGTIRTYFKPRKGIKYWEGQVKNMLQSKIRMCACCGKPLRFPYSCNEICKVCGWEDDALQNDDPQFDGGANEMSLEQAKAAYQQGLPVY